MSNLDRQAALTVCGGRGFVVAEPVRELLSPRRVQLGESTEVRRLLPNLGRRMIGAWAFVDHYGPDDIADEPGMQVPPHPHMGLQTVSWLHEGEVLHRDSTGSLQTVRPRELGLMTSGRAISHSEESPRPHARLLHGAQLWVALPDAHRHVEPHFEHHADLPRVTAPGLTATVILGSLDGAASPGTTYSPLVGADLALAAGTETALPLEPDFEYAVLAMSGEAEVDGVPVLPGSMLYLGCGRTELPLRAVSEAGLMLLGGEPFEEEIVMWWNFVGRTDEEIREAREDWMTSDRFGEVKGYDGGRLDAPEVPPTPLKARGRVR
ncbi:pirin family protein [Streptomyces sp. NPDC090303]|uniref:pirin family protein n=1 Tax=Streptomyces sp. NPDC090303 TaxID=3365960 RepID=UPI0038212425